MNLALMLALQVAAPAAAAAAPTAAADFDLAKYRPSADPDRGCGEGEGGEIVVCGRRRRPEAYPYDKMERKFAKGPIVAEKDIGGGATARAYVESVDMPGGQTSKRVMVGVRLPF